MPLIALYGEVAAAIPLHLATRSWLRLCPGREVSAAEKRWALLLQCLHQFTLTFDPPLKRGVPALSKATVTPWLKTCPQCGSEFFGYRVSKTCGCRVRVKSYLEMKYGIRDGQRARRNSDGHHADLAG